MSDSGFKPPWKPNNPRQRLADILERGESILRIVIDLDRDTFERDPVKNKAVCYDMLCISEAVSRLLVLDPTLEDRHPEVPWHQIRAIANVLRHVYGNVELDILWDAIVGGELRLLISVVMAELQDQGE